MDLLPPQCGACGAPVPLADGDVATCVHCSTPLPIDEAHRRLRQAAKAARRQRRETEAALRRRLERCPPSWLLRVYAYVVIPAVVIAVPLGFGMTQAEYGWFAREWVVLAGVLPFMVALLPALVLWSLGNPGAYLDAFGAKLRPAPPRPDAVGVGCGLCGAPLEVELDAYAATCDYCGADSWVREQPGGYEHGEDQRREAANLTDLVRAEQFRIFDIRQLLVVYPTVTAIACGVLYALLPGRAAWDAIRYERSVDDEWHLVGRPGPVVDLAVVGEGLVAVGRDGRVQEYRDDQWELVEDAHDVLGVGGSADRALLVGHRGMAAWLEDGRLESVELGLSTDLNDAWIGPDGSAAVVGSAGTSAMFDGEAWSVLPTTNGNDLLAVWGWDRAHVFAAGGINVWTLADEQWSGESLQGLPRVVDVHGYGETVYIATQPLDEASVWVDVYTRGDGEWDMLMFGAASYHAVVAGPDIVWAVGPAGYVEYRDADLALPPVHPPGPGDVDAAVLWGGRLVVGGADGVFERAD